jgi:hypothetical protein
MSLRAAEVAQNILETLATIYVPAGGFGLAKMFAKSGLYDDVASFLAVGDDALKGKAVGVIGTMPTRGPGLGNGEAYTEAVEYLVVYSFTVKRAAGEDESAGVITANDMAGKIRDALLMDKSRGGRCGFFRRGGRIVNGTSVEGEARIIDTLPNQAIYTAQLPVACGWWVEQT